jgi:hypothetical protein
MATHSEAYKKGVKAHDRSDDAAAIIPLPVNEAIRLDPNNAREYHNGGLASFVV